METRTSQAHLATSAEEEWTTPATQQLPDHPQPDSSIDQRNTGMGKIPSRVQEAEDTQVHPPSNGIDGTDLTPTMPNADDWLDDILIGNDNLWIHDATEIDPSPPTLMATDPRTVLGRTYKGCRCPRHQDIYNDWPTQDAELIIAQCMRTCMYCGRDFPRSAADLRKHLRSRTYSRKNISIHQEMPGKVNPATPAWTLRPRARTLDRMESEPPARPSTLGQPGLNSLQTVPMQQHDHGRTP